MLQLCIVVVIYVRHVKHVYEQPYLNRHIWGQKRKFFNVPICHIPLTANISLSFYVERKKKIHGNVPKISLLSNLISDIVN